MSKYAELLDRPPITSLKVNRPRREFDDTYGPFDSHSSAWAERRQRALATGDNRGLLLATTLATALHAGNLPNYETPELTQAEELRLVGLLGLSRFLLYLSYEDEHDTICEDLGFRDTEMRLDMETDPAWGLQVGSMSQDGLEITFADTGSIPRHPSLHYAANSGVAYEGDPHDQWCRYAGALYLRRQVQSDTPLLPVTITPYYPSGTHRELRPEDPIPYPQG